MNINFVNFAPFRQPYHRAKSQNLPHCGIIVWTTLISWIASFPRNLAIWNVSNVDRSSLSATDTLSSAYRVKLGIFVNLKCFGVTQRDPIQWYTADIVAEEGNDHVKTLRSTWCTETTTPSPFSVGSGGTRRSRAILNIFNPSVSSGALAISLSISLHCFLSSASYVECLALSSASDLAIYMLCRVALWTQMVNQRINSEV